MTTDRQFVDNMNPGRPSGRPRHTKSQPIVPAVGGRPPGFVVACLDCSFAHDAHGESPEDAVRSLAPSHASGHRLVAQSIDYTAPIYGRDRNQSHPLYPEAP